MRALHNKGQYPDNWDEIARAVKEAAGWCCIRCTHAHDPSTGHTLTVHHWDGDKGNIKWWNLMALCQRCHLSIQGRVDPAQPFMFEHSEWCKVYAAGYYAYKYLGQVLDRKWAEARMGELLQLERQA